MAWVQFIAFFSFGLYLSLYDVVSRYCCARIRNISGYLCSHKRSTPNGLDDLAADVVIHIDDNCIHEGFTRIYVKDELETLVLGIGSVSIFE